MSPGGGPAAGWIPPPSGGGQDVLVVAEDVLRVVLPLDPSQPLVLSRPERSPDPLLALVAEEVQIGRAVAVTRHRLEELARPADVCGGAAGVGPGGNDVQGE